MRSREGMHIFYNKRATCFGSTRTNRLVLVAVVTIVPDSNLGLLHHRRPTDLLLQSHPVVDQRLRSAEDVDDAIPRDDNRGCQVIVTPCADLNIDDSGLSVGSSAFPPRRRSGLACHWHARHTRPWEETQPARRCRCH